MNNDNNDQDVECPRCASWPHTACVLCEGRRKVESRKAFAYMLVMDKKPITVTQIRMVQHVIDDNFEELSRFLTSLYGGE